MDNIIHGFPRQALPHSKKTKKWAEECVRFADKNTVLSSSLIRKTVAHKKINYDLFSGQLNMKDVEMVLNDGTDYGLPTKQIQHYPIMNTSINLLLGEERASQFDFRVMITNPNAISEIEEEKKAQIQQEVQRLVENSSLSEDEYNQKMQKLSDFFTYEWQDLREIRANCLLNHYKKEQNFDATFNDGFADVAINNEEIYQCTIEGYEPVLRKLNPMKVQVWGAGSSSKVEDADMIVIEDYWPRNRILDVYGDQLTKKQIDDIEEWTSQGDSSERFGDKGDPRNYFRFGDYVDQLNIDGDGGWVSFTDGVSTRDLPFDIKGNIRVLQVYWKSIRKIKRVKSYNPETGKAEYTYKTEDYIPDESKGEEAKIQYVNEAWHGTMIGAGDKAIFVDMGPCQVQYNSMSNPSKCHFGIIGTIYNINESTPYSMVDMMKPLQYMYDVVSDRTLKLINRNLGKIINLNLSMVPAGWSISKWLDFARNKGVSVTDPFKEGNQGAAKGKLAGAFANTAPVLDLELGNSIQNNIALLDHIEQTMKNMVGISRQREGQVANRETVGGVERATLQSSHTTRWYFAKHEDTKKRVLECFLETAKIAMRGRTKKFQYILPDHSQKLIDVDGDMFAECDYGLVVDSGYDMQALNQEIQQIAQAAMQNNTLTFSTYLKLRSNCSIAEKIRMVENDENRAREAAQQAAQQQMQIESQKAQQELKLKQAELEQKDVINQRDNETKLLIANIQAQYKKDADGDGVVNEGEDTQDLSEQIRQFDEKIKLDRDKFEYQKQKDKRDNDTKLAIAKMRPKNKTD